MVDELELLLCLLFALLSIIAIAFFWHNKSSVLVVHGKLVASSTRTAASNDRLQIHKSWFGAFYIFGFLLNLPLLHALEFDSWIGIMPFMLIQLHYSRRIFECIFVHRYSANSSMHLGHLFVGFCHYFLLELSFFISHVRREHNFHLIVTGALLFMLSSIGQFLSHLALTSLRSEDFQWKYPPPEHLFKYLVCPHYFFEVAIYVSFWLLNSLSFPLCYALLWTFTNLSISATNTMEWYSKTFPIEHATCQCISKRWAIFPCLV